MRIATVVLALFLLLGASVALAQTTYPDKVGDVTGGRGPDITSVRVSNTKAAVTFSVRFAKAPPLRFNAGAGWVDMLLVGIDVPPLGPGPVSPGGPWLGANFAAGTHGPSTRGQMVRLAQGTSRRVATFPIATSGSTLTFSLPRRALGNPASFAFTVAAAREMAQANEGGVDVAPARGVFRYRLTG
jgi:hypothetical protein